MRIATLRLAIILVACWLVAVTESALSHVTKRTESWRKHYKVFDAHVGMFAPPAGFEKLDVVFREPAPEDDREHLLSELQDMPHLRKPDIYVFMVESWRSDSITPEVAPFLSRFGKIFRHKNMITLGTHTIGQELFANVLPVGCQQTAFFS